METKKIKFGVLGAANITKMALMDPAKQLHDIVEVYAIAARDKQRAINYAKKHAISKVYETYEEVIDDPEIDAIYIPLPNSLHHKWSIAAMRKGKHVLCEKPIANNEEEAKEMIRVSNETGKFIYEAFHYRHHPCIKRVKEIIISNEIGLIQSLDASFCVPIFSSNDIRYNYELGGGAMMDTGCYVINLLRYITDLEPIIDSAVPVYCKQLPHSPFGSIDQSIHGTCHFDRILHRHDNDNNNNDGDDNDDSKKEGGQIEEERQPITATFKTSLFSIIPSVSLRVKGKEGEIDVTNWVAPQFYHKITIFNKKTNKKRSEKVSGLFANDTTYFYQLRTFTQYLKQLRGDDDVKDLVITLPFPPEDSILNMIAIGNIYKKAGMPIRGEPFPVPEVRDAPNDSLDDDNDEINNRQIVDVENSNIIHSENDQPIASGVEIESDIKVEDQNDKKEIEIKEISNAENDANIEAKIDEINSSELSQKEELDHEMEKETI